MKREKVMHNNRALRICPSKCVHQNQLLTYIFPLLAETQVRHFYFVIVFSYAKINIFFALNYILILLFTLTLEIFSMHLCSIFLHLFFYYIISFIIFKNWNRKSNKNVAILAFFLHLFLFITSYQLSYLKIEITKAIKMLQF